MRSCALTATDRPWCRVPVPEHAVDVHFERGNARVAVPPHVPTSWSGRRVGLPLWVGCGEYSDSDLQHAPGATDAVSSTVVGVAGAYFDVCACVWCCVDVACVDRVKLCGLPAIWTLCCVESLLCVAHLVSVLRSVHIGPRCAL